MSQTLYEMVGGETGVRKLVDRFYDLMHSDPRAAELRALHPEVLDHSRDKLFWFFTGWMGGPQLYVERFGHPRLRARHLPFSIGVLERDQWMMCMNQALAEMDLPPMALQQLQHSLGNLADFMRNREE